MFSWGGGGSYNKGQCGHFNVSDIETPRKIGYFEGRKVEDIRCGGFHTFCLTDANELFSFGKNMFGQLGHGGTKEDAKIRQVCFPEKYLSLIDEAHVKQFELGGNHSLVLFGNGVVFSFGHGMSGQLGLGDTRNRSHPRVIKSLLRKNVEQIAAGWNHSLVLTDKGFLYSCGSNKHGELCFSSGSKKSFTLVKTDIKVEKVFAGGNHTFITVNGADPVIPDWEDNSVLQSDEDSIEETVLKEKSVDNKEEIAVLEVLEEEKGSVSAGIRLKVVYTDIEKSHRFIRFCLKSKYQHSLPLSRLEKYFQEFLSDQPVLLSRIQEDSAIDPEEEGLAEILLNIGCEQINVEKGSFTAMIVIDVQKDSKVKALKNYLGSLRKQEIGGDFAVVDFEEDRLRSDSTERMLSEWVLEFKEQFEEIIEEDALFVELRPKCFYFPK